MDDPSAAAPSTTAGTAGATSGPLASAEWPARAADMVEAVVAGVHDKVVRPLLLAARAVVFGILVAAMLLVLSVLAAVAVVRLLDVYAFGGRVWASDLLVGGVFTLAGFALWSRRRRRGEEEG